MVNGKPRYAEHRGKVYVIRDVWSGKPRAGSPLVNGSLVRCEYGRLRPSGRMKWTPCAEGTYFSAIRPMGGHR